MAGVDAFVPEHDERFGKVGPENLTLSNCSDGYCLVFQRLTPHFELRIENEKLVTEFCDNWTEKEREKIKFAHFHNIVEMLSQAKIKYTMQYSNDPKKSWVFVIISVDMEVAEAYAARREIQVQINPREAIKHGRRFREFNLAHRTWLEDGKDDLQFQDESGRTYNKLSIELWKHTHISYTPDIPRVVYQTFPPTNSVLDSRLFLRILYDILTDDKKIGGAQFRVTAYLNNSHHPLKQFFALQGDKSNHPGMSKQELMHPHRNPFWDDKINQLRHYYGEAHTFYFAFLLHYTNWLYVIAAVGIPFFVAQVGTGQVAVQGSPIFVLICLFWSTFMIETWYRREWTLSHKWGTMKYKQTEIPRPTFRGVIVVSEANGELIEDHKSILWYYIKMVFSLSTISVSVLCIIAVVFGIWELKKIWGSQPTYSIGIGIINSIQIQIMNKLYQYLAFVLNEYEGHRLEQDYYNHLVVKRILFLIINSFNSLFYLAFYESNYPNNEACLEAVRTQLLTLFFTALVITNFFDLALPIIYTYVTDKMTNYQEKKFVESHEDENVKQIENNINVEMINDANNANSNVVDKEPTDEEEDDENKTDEPVVQQKPKPKEEYKPFPVTQEILDDVNSQIDKSPSPDILYSTSESIIQYGYIMLFTFVFPLMPAIGVITNYFQFRIDYYNVVTCQRPVPLAANGIGVWKHVLAAFSIIAVFTNIALLTFKTSLIGHLIGSSQIKWKIVFFFVSSIIILFSLFLIRFSISDIPAAVQKAIEREETCEKYLLLDSAEAMAEEMEKNKAKNN